MSQREATVTKFSVTVNGPKMHKEFMLNERVTYKIHRESDEKFVGTIVGVSSIHVINIYIVLLDEPLTLPGYEGWRAIAIPGTELTGI